MLPAVVVACPYRLPDGATCNNPKLSARGYCVRHYNVLRRAGAFTDIVPKPPAHDPDLVLANVKSVKRAQRKLLKLAPTFVDHLLAGSAVAAIKGDTSAAQWAILHARVIGPVNVNGRTNESDSGKVIVNVGVKVSAGANDTNK